MFIKCPKIEFSNSQSTITGITLFPDEELFILALYFTFLQQPISIRYVSFCFFIIILVFSGSHVHDISIHFQFL